MGDDPRPEDEVPSLVTPEPREEMSPEISFVVPAPPYESIATDEASAPSPVTASPPPTFVDLTPALEAFEALGEGLHQKLDRLHSLFEREVRAEATREKVVDRLHAELQEYKQDLLLNVLRPVFVDLIQLHDDIGKMVEARSGGEYAVEAEGEVRRLLDIMLGYQQGIEDILYRQGVEPYQQEGDAFDPRRQRAVATVETEDPALAKRIAIRHRKGFQTQGGERVIRPEIVSVYALKR